MSKIQVISGKFKGLKLDSSKNEGLRPTKDRVKESIFDILQFEIVNKTFFDAFGGTGQIGIEALSRGAGEVIIVEHNKEAADLIKKNISKIKDNKNLNFIKADTIEFLKNSNISIDIAFLDPPYHDEKILYDTFKLITQKTATGAIIITETLSAHNAQNNVENFYLQKRYKYGNISLNLYKKQ